MKRVVFTTSHRLARRGFSLVEILLAVMILGVGLIMVASVFPVGANWTRQNVEETISAVVARNAVSIIQTKYKAADLVNVGTGLQALPLRDASNNIIITPAERAYDYGREPPYPAVYPTKANYLWSALVKPNYAVSGVKSYDLYILVFSKGNPNQVFTPGAGEVSGCREIISTPPEFYFPGIELNTITNTRFPVGSLGIGSTSGVVFRKLQSSTNPAVTDTQAYYVPPASDSTTSPLVYIYQTTISF